MRPAALALQQFTLQPLTLQVRRQPGPLLAQIEAALRIHGEPLRWAITAVEASDFDSAGVLDSLLTLEAVLLV